MKTVIAAVLAAAAIGAGGGYAAGHGSKTVDRPSYNQVANECPDVYGHNAAGYDVCVDIMADLVDHGFVTAPADGQY